MLMTILNVVYVLLAVAMIAMILMQRGAGAAAGSGFGGGASSTVFGSRGASNFLSKSTKWLAIVFFGISLFMAWYATHSAGGPAVTDLGVMAQQPAGSTPAKPVDNATPQAPAANGAVPAAPAAAPQPADGSSVPAAPQPAPPAETQAPQAQQQPAQAPPQN